MTRSPQLKQERQEQQEEEKLVRAWEGPMEQAAVSLLGARLKVGPKVRVVGWFIQHNKCG